MFIVSYIDLCLLYSASAGAQRMLLGVFMSLLYAFLNSRFPQKYIFSEDFKVSKSVIKTFYQFLRLYTIRTVKLCLINFCCNVQLFRFRTILSF